MKKFTVTSETDLKTFTDATYPQGSVCFSALLRDKDIKVNGARVSKSVGLKAGDEVIYYTNPKQESFKSHEVIFEDGNILIADKPDGVETSALLCELCAGGEFYAVHRLDRNTKGLVVFAKNRAAEGELLAAFKERTVEKTYLALCKNGFKRDEALLTAYLKKDPSSATVKVYDGKGAGSVKIVTGYRVLERRGDIALAEVALHTGKTHQIRAHLAHIGCPVLGDNKYGDGALNDKYGKRRQCLVSYRLSFRLGGVLGYLDGKEFTSNFTP